MNSGSMSAGVPTIKCEEASPGGGGGGRGGGDAGGAAGGGGSAYNLSVNVNLSAAVSSLLAAESAATTPRTPEILNSLIAMSSPLEQYNYNKNTNNAFKGGSGNDSNSSLSNASSAATSPANGTTPSIQKTCSELIKAGLKLSIESKRKMSGSDSETCIKRFKKEDSDDDYDSSHTTTTKGEGLTPEDEERRRRRRERNKIAATKCRMKKRERTVNLVTESEVLESQNIDLKSQLKDLEVQRRQLIDMLSLHTASCMKGNTTSASPATPYNMIRPYESPTTFPTSYEASSPYIRPESANILASSYTCVTPLNGDSSIDTITSLDNAYMPPQMLESEYHRPESVLSLQSTSESGYGTTDGYLPKATHLLVIESGESEYYEQEVSYNMGGSQQCHTYPGAGGSQDHQAKLNNALSDTCLV